MCHYVTAVVPGAAGLDAVSAILNRHGFGFRQIANRHVQSQLRAGDVQILTTRAMCDCGTPLASRSRSVEPAAHPQSMLPKLRARGWSEARIQRWLAERAAAE